MYGVALDASGNYVLIGGSGDEYTYSETDPNTNWSSDIWVSYLVVVDPATVRFQKNESHCQIKMDCPPLGHCFV